MIVRIHHGDTEDTEYFRVFLRDLRVLRGVMGKLLNSHSLGWLTVSLIELRLKFFEGLSATFMPDSPSTALRSGHSGMTTEWLDPVRFHPAGRAIEI